MSAPPSAEFLAEAAYYIRVTQIHFCAMYAVVIWDWLVSLNRERRLIWDQPWSVLKGLYLGSRYWVIAVMPFVLWVFTTENHSAADCARLYNIPVLLCMWNQLWSESILLIRTHALLGRNRIVLIVLCTFLGVIAGYQIYVGLVEMAPLPFVVAPFDKGPCFPQTKNIGAAHVMGFFVAPLIFDTIVTLMTLVQAFKIRKAGATNSPILATFVREGVFYFLLISIANLINGIFYFQPNPTMSAICIPLSIMFPDILACRLILDLREQGNGGAATSGKTSSNGIFSARPATKGVHGNPSPYYKRQEVTEGSILPTTIDVTKSHGTVIEMNQMAINQHSNGDEDSFDGKYDQKGDFVVMGEQGGHHPGRQRSKSNVTGPIPQNYGSNSHHTSSTDSSHRRDRRNTGHSPSSSPPVGLGGIRVDVESVIQKV